MVERGITEEEVRSILEKPDYARKSFADRHIAVKKIDSMIWNVVYVVEGKLFKVITIYYD